MTGERLIRHGSELRHDAGTRYEWIVPVYVRKLAFLHTPLSPKLLRMRRLYQSVKRWLPGGSRAAPRPTLQGWSA